MRRWDLAASGRVDRYVANSRLTQERIARFYGRESEIIHPPVDTARFPPGEPGDSLLIVSELVRHKRLHVALEAARRAGAPIRVAGSGPDHDALAAAFPEAEFVGRVGDAELERALRERASGARPEQGGVRHHRRRGAGLRAAGDRGRRRRGTGDRARRSTGRLVALDDVEAFRAAIVELDQLGFDPGEAVRNAERFSVAAFRRGLDAQVAAALAARR